MDAFPFHCADGNVQLNSLTRQCSCNHMYPRIKHVVKYVRSSVCVRYYSSLESDQCCCFSRILFLRSVNIHLHSTQWWLTLRMKSSAQTFWYYTAEAQHIQKDMPGTQPQEEIEQQMQDKTGRYAYLFMRSPQGWVNDLPFGLIHFILWYRKK